MALPSYKGNEDFYKENIQKINEDVDFAGFLLNSGYKVKSKSAGSIELVGNGDRIVINMSRSIATYFNRNDDTDKGWPFQYFKNRYSFYDAVERGLNEINATYRLDNIQKEDRSKKTAVPLEDRYNIEPLRNSNYLTINRRIAKRIINGTMFSGRIYNAFHISARGGKIPNIAFPKYDVDGNIKNYVLRNAPYQDKQTKKMRKFQLVLNRKDSYLFFSNPKIDFKNVYLVENEIDAMSHAQLNGVENEFYISFGGQLYDEKMNQLMEILNEYAPEEKTIVSLMDKDVTGFGYDLMLTEKFFNSSALPYQLSLVKTSDEIRIRLIDTEKGGSLDTENLRWSDHLKARDSNIMVVRFKDRLELVLKRGKDPEEKLDRMQQNVPIIVAMFNDLYEMRFPIRLEKPQIGTDWNEMLKSSGTKKNELNKTESLKNLEGPTEGQSL